MKQDGPSIYMQKVTRVCANMDHKGKLTSCYYCKLARLISAD